MTSARDAAIKGDWWLLGEPLDKPPLTHYINAVAIVYIAAETSTDGVLQLDALRGEFAGRIPSLLASILLVAVVAQLARTVTGDQNVAVIAATLTALSPLRLAFSATAFTDMPMLLLAALSLLLAVRNRHGWAGFWWGLSLAAKPQSIFYLPLLLILIWMKRKTARDLLRFALPVIAILICLVLWDGLRVSQGATSFYLLGQARYTPTTITPLAQYPERFLAWWQTAQYALGSPLLTVGLLGVAGWAASRTKSQAIRWLALWVLAFAGSHIVLTLNLFDRNQLLLLPPLLVMAATGVTKLAGRWPQMILVVLILALLPPALQAARHQYPIGGDDGRHEGIHQLAQVLNSKPVATVIYDRWLDWELDYYMGAWTDKRRVYYPTPQELVAGARSLDEAGIRYIVIPQWIEDRQDWIVALDHAGFAPELAYMIATFEVWRLVPPENQ